MPKVTYDEHKQDVKELVKSYHQFVVANRMHDEKRASELLAQRDAIAARDPSALEEAAEQSLSIDNMAKAVNELLGFDPGTGEDTWN